MPVYNLDMQQRFARITKQRSDEKRQSTVLSAVARVRKVTRASPNEPTAAQALNPTIARLPKEMI
jgi:hypothetical protein